MLRSSDIALILMSPVTASTATNKIASRSQDQIRSALKLTPESR